MVSYIYSRKPEGAAVRHAVLEGASGARRSDESLTTCTHDRLGRQCGFHPYGSFDRLGCSGATTVGNGVIGGVISSTILTSLILPVPYELSETRFMQRGAALR